VIRIKLKKGIKKVGWVNPWIYRNEILDIPPHEEGEICDVFDFSNNYVGRGYLNERSFITVRLLSHSPEKIDRTFFTKKIVKALKKREKFKGAFRLVHSEADGMPGVVADLFGKHLVVQFNTLGMEKMKDKILNSFEEVLDLDGIFEKSEGRARKREGLEKSVGWIRGEGKELIPFQFDGVEYFSDTLGQKTGFFLDQRFNAKALRNFAHGIVLDAFSYTGNFSINAFKGGADKVISIDRSQRAGKVYEEILKANNVKSGYEIVIGNAFDELRKFEREGRSFDLIILDPPAFAKSRKELSAALRGYKEINLRAMKILKNGGFLATASCSAALDRESFLNVVKEAAFDVHKELRIVYFGIQSYDHPVLIGMKESEYLKFFIFEVEAIS